MKTSRSQVRPTFTRRYGMKGAMLPLLFCLPLDLPAQAVSQPPGGASSTRTAPRFGDRSFSEAYAQIRAQEDAHSEVMAYAEAITVRLGPRLTGSPQVLQANRLTRHALEQMGCQNAHLEDWGEFGIGWQAESTSLRLTTPRTMTLMTAAVPWSPGTGSSRSTQKINSRAVVHVDLDRGDPDFATKFSRYKGLLANRVVFLGRAIPVGHVLQPVFSRRSEEQLKESSGPTKAATLSAEGVAAYQQHLAEVSDLLAKEHPYLIVLPSIELSDHGGSGGTLYDDFSAGFSYRAFRREHAPAFPLVVTGIEDFDRAVEILKTGSPVRAEAEVHVVETGDHVHGFNTIAEIPGSDPLFKDQVVMLGAHLDSWTAGEGATDNGAGVAVAMEVMRLILQVDPHPRRTIRVAFWTGEEEGLLGSEAYVREHLGSFPRPVQPLVPAYLLERSGPVALTAEGERVSVYFNLDTGTGKIRGIDLQGDLQAREVLSQWIAPLRDLGVVALRDRYSNDSDNVAFDQIGIPAFQFVQDYMEYNTRTYHSNMDTFPYLSAEDLRQAAVVEASLVYAAAEADQQLPRR